MKYSTVYYFTRKRHELNFITRPSTKYEPCMCAEYTRNYILYHT